MAVALLGALAACGSPKGQPREALPPTLGHEASEDPAQPADPPQADASVGDPDSGEPLPVEGEVESAQEPLEAQDEPLMQGLSSGAAVDVFLTIARLEDARTTGGGYLQTLLGHESEAVRARAAASLGRLARTDRGAGASVTDALVYALEDVGAPVRAAAAFALGLRADPQAAEDIIAAIATEVDPSVRAVLVEAASKHSHPAARAAVLAALEDPSPLVRHEALIGPHRWPAGEADDERVDAALIEHATGPSRWCALFTLQRRGSLDARALYLEVLGEESATDLERLFACQGISRLAGGLRREARVDRDGEMRKLVGALLRHVNSADWRVAYEAVAALGNLADDRARPILHEAANASNVHVRAAACTALGELGPDEATSEWLMLLAEADQSATVRGAALAAAAKHGGEAAAALVSAAAVSDNPVMRAYAAAAANAESASSLAVLLALSYDQVPSVVEAAITALGKLAEAAASERVLELVSNMDNGIALQAVQSLPRRLPELAVPPLIQKFQRASGDIAPELRATIIDRLSAAAQEGAFNPTLHAEVRALFTDVAKTGRPYSAQRARLALEALGIDPPPRTEEPPLATVLPKGIPSGPGAAPNPRIRISTEKGVLEFELFLDDAPLHVISFITLAEKGYYDNLLWHRVVPDFVVQGGCYRGDGNGSGTWRGTGNSLRHEINPRKYLRGTLGMPRNDDLESGGNQLFVTHRPTPHLDGRYTVFGELREGFDVLDALEVGDHILSIERIDG